MLVPDPQTPGGERTKLLDFGIAKLSEPGPTASAQRVQTKADQVLGTPTYMSPEQCEGAGQVDAKSDVYSLGVLLFEMLAGRPPFVAEGGGKVQGMHMFVAPPPLQKLAPDAPAPLCEVIHRLLSKRRDERPTMQKLAAALETLAQLHPLPKRSGSLPALAADGGDVLDTLARASSGGTSTLGLSASQTLGPPRSRRLKFPVLAGALVATCAGALVVAFRAPPPPAHPPPSLHSGSATRPAPPKSVTLRIDSEPPGATVIQLADGQEVGRTPWQLTQPANAGPLRVLLRMEGHEDHELLLAGDIDDQASIRLLPRRGMGGRPAPRGTDRTDKLDKQHPGAAALSTTKLQPLHPIVPNVPGDSPTGRPPVKPRPLYVKPPLEK